VELPASSKNSRGLVEERTGKKLCCEIRMLLMARNSQVIRSAALGLLAFGLPNQAIRIQAQSIKDGKPVISAYRRSDEGPGRMHLLPGYVAGLPEGQTCIDTECGFIWNPQGLTIDYDIGGMAGVSIGPDRPGGTVEYSWYGEANINSQPVRYAVSGAGRSASLSISFPSSSANFNSEVRSEAEIQTVLQMVLTYQGVGYKPQPEGTVDGRVVKRDGTPLEGIEVTVAQDVAQHKENETKTTRTDDGGHFRFLSVPPGRYSLTARKSNQTDCEFSPQRWRIRIDPAQIQMRSFIVQCR
jgi:hypothetical protein